MVIAFSRGALIGRASSMGDYTGRAVKAWLSLMRPDGRADEPMFWNVDAEFVERNRLKIEEECIDMAIRAVLVYVRDCPSVRVFYSRRIDEELRREGLRTGQVVDVDSYTLNHVRYTERWDEHIDVVNAGNRVHRCTDGSWTRSMGCMVLTGRGSGDLMGVLLGERPLGDIPKGNYCELEDETENKTEKEKHNGKKGD